MESLRNRCRILRRNAEQRQSRPIGHSAALFPVAQSRDVNADHERELTLRGTKFLSYRFDFRWLEHGHARGPHGAAPNATGLPNAGEQFLKRFGLHLNSSRMSCASAWACFGV